MVEKLNRSWLRLQLFGWQTFKRVGASLVIRRIYNAVLVLSIVIQLSAFFIVAVGGLWLDQVWNGQIASLTAKPTAMKAVAILVILLLFPWLFLVRFSFLSLQFTLANMSFHIRAGFPSAVNTRNACSPSSSSPPSTLSAGPPCLFQEHSVGLSCNGGSLL